jgi:hypothetical protein
MARSASTGRITSTRPPLPNVGETQFWFTAGHGVTDVSGAASAWSTRTGNFSCTQGTGAARPTITTNINGRNTLTFTAASNQELTNTTTNLVFTNAQRYVLIVARSAAGTGGTLMTFRFNTTGSNRVWCLQAPIASNLNYMTDGVSNSVAETVAAPSLTSPFIIEYEIILGGTPVIRFNGAARTVSGTIHSAGEAGATGFHIGGREAGSGQFFDGDIADIYCASGIPSTDDKSTLRSFFANLNGITL